MIKKLTSLFLISLLLGNPALADISNSTVSAFIADSNGNTISSSGGSLNTSVTNTVPVSQSGSWTVGISGTIPISGTLTANQGTSPWVNNITQFGGSNVVTGTGISGSGIPRVTVSNDSNILATQSGSWTTGRTWTLGSGTDSVTAVQSGTWNQNLTQVNGTSISLGQGIMSASFPVAIASNQSAIPSSQSGTWTVQQGSGPWTQNVTQFGSSNVVTGTGASGAGIPRVTVSNDSNVLSTQSGSWTVTSNQGTANTLANAWSTKITDATNGPVAVKAASTAAIATDPSLVVALSPNSSVPTGVNNIGSITNVTGTVSLPTGASTSANQTNGNQKTQIVDGSGNVISSTTNSLNTNITNIVPVSQSGVWTTGRTWSLSSGSDSVTSVQGTSPWVSNVSQFGGNNVVTGTGVSGVGIPRVTVSSDSNVLATQSGTWNLNNITGTVSLPTGASTSAIQTNGTQLAQAVDALGHVVTVKPASTATIATDTSLVTAFSPNSPLPTGSSVIGALVANQSINLNQVGGASFTLGQQLASASLPVVTQSDATPSTQNVTIQDIASTTTAYANNQNFITGTPTVGSVATFSFSSFEAVEVLVTGTWTGTLETDVSMDGGTTWFTRGIKQAGAAYISSSFTANFAGGLNFSGMTNFRVRAIAAMTGTATVKVIASINPGSITVSNPLILRDSTTQSIADTIKASSTAAQVTDTSLVVGLSPNSPIPAGSNNIGSITNVTGTVSLPTGAATSANQSTIITDLGSIITNTNPLNYTQGSTTSGQNGNLVQGAVTTSPPSYSTAQTDPLSLTTSGSLRTDLSSVDGTATVTAGVNGLLAVGGNVASGVADSGDPVKAGSVFNSTLPTPTTGNRVDLQSDFSGSLAISLRNHYRNIVGAATTVLKSGAGRLHTIVIGASGGGFSVTAYDNTAGSGTIITTITNATTGQLTTLTFDVEFTTGLTVVTTGGGNNITVSYY